MNGLSCFDHPCLGSGDDQHVAVHSGAHLASVIIVIDVMIIMIDIIDWYDDSHQVQDVAPLPVRRLELLQVVQVQLLGGVLRLLSHLEWKKDYKEGGTDNHHTWKPTMEKTNTAIVNMQLLNTRQDRKYARITAKAISDKIPP